MIQNSIITDTTFDFNVIKLSIKDANIDKCQFKGKIENTSISEKVTKCLFKGEIENAQISKDISNCQFEGLFGEESNKIMITGYLNDMVIQQDITPSSAKYVQKLNNSSEYIEIASLEISSKVVPRLGKTLHKECFIDTRDGKEVFIVQVPTDDNNPRGTILMFYPGILQEGQTLESIIPEGYAICDGKTDGVPDLRGRFIRMVGIKDETEALEQYGEKNNDDLEKLGEYTRQAYLKKVPAHTHSFKTYSGNASINTSNFSIKYDKDIEYTLYANLNGITTSKESTEYYKLTTSTEASFTINPSGYKNGESDKDILQEYVTTTKHYHSLSGEIPIEGSINLPSIITEGYLSLDLENFALEQDTEAENFQEAINIEPQAYALIFIMKL